MKTVAKCRYCPAPILWAVTGNGKRIPLNPDPSPNGNLMLEFPVRGNPLATVVKDPRSATCALYVSHFADCVGAKTARRKR